MNVKSIGSALIAWVAVVPTIASAQISIGISVNVAPPPLPVYVQPPVPGPDFIWTPGYWAWDDDAYAYFWVPGTWVRAPRPGLLWTPPWWGWVGGGYSFHTGYWGPTVGFYGGVPYGFGYTGVGFQGGFWSGGHVFYNSAVTNVTNVTNIYRATVIENHVTRVSYNGGPGGIRARATPQELVAARQPHLAPTANQATHFAAARNDPRLFASANHGAPPVMATPRALSPMHPAGAVSFAGPLPDGRGGRAGAKPSALSNDRVVQPPANMRPQPYRNSQMLGDRSQPYEQRRPGSEAVRPGQPFFGSAPMGNPRPVPVEREAFMQGGGNRHSMQPPHEDQPHIPPPHRAPPRPPQQPRPHPQNHPQGQKHEEHH